MKKIKDSAKAEMKKAVQKELSRIMAKQIAKEDFFKEMVQEIVSDFFEEDAIKETAIPHPEQPWNWGTTTPERLKLLAGIKKGELKDEFSKIINKNLNSEEKEYFEQIADSPNIKNSPDFNRLIKRKNSNVLFTDEQMRTLFDPARLAEKEKAQSSYSNDIVFGKANPQNINKLSGFVKDQAIEDYSRINYTQEVKDNLFDYIKNNKSSLEATHEQFHINPINSMERYHVTNKKNLHLDKTEVAYKFNRGAYNINPEHFSFNVEIKTNTKTNIKAVLLNDVYLKGEYFPHGHITFDDVTKLLDIAQQIYSDTIICPLSETRIEETQVERVNRIKKPRRSIVSASFKSSKPKKINKKERKVK